MDRIFRQLLRGGNMAGRIRNTSDIPELTKFLAKNQTFKNVVFGIQEGKAVFKDMIKSAVNSKRFLKLENKSTPMNKKK